MIKSFDQQAWHEQLKVSIEKGAVVTVDDKEVCTSREQALAWIVLRLNGQNLYLNQEVNKMKELAEQLKYLIRHIKSHEGQPDLGYSTMRPDEKELYNYVTKGCETDKDVNTCYCCGHHRSFPMSPGKWEYRESAKDEWRPCLIKESTGKEHKDCPLGVMLFYLVKVEGEEPWWDEDEEEAGFDPYNHPQPWPTAQWRKR